MNRYRLACRAFILAATAAAAVTAWAVLGPAPWALVPGFFLICALICCAGITGELARDARDRARLAERRARELRDGPPLDEDETAAFTEITRHYGPGTAA
ncbi:hypothetical protein ACH4UY_04800 [Streptomyces longwoodensis]|uniref:hypothetical protein n=1 Tax=Streptomyces longwoodensis TaxID=68231 RepID=UPI00379586B4